MRTLLWLAIPYLVMESGYIIMASLLPINDHIARLTPSVFINRLLIHPLGPYWYLHTLILCGAVYYYIYNNLQRGMVTRFILIGITYYVSARVLGILSFSSALYFLAGAVLRQRNSDFLSFFWPTRLSVISFALLACFSDSPNQASLNGALIVYFAISSLLSLYTITSFKISRWTCFLGRNSLLLYVFSPIFTIFCKQLIPYLQFDPTGLIFLLISLVICVAGSLAIAWLMDLFCISRFFFGRQAIN